MDLRVRRTPNPLARSPLAPGRPDRSAHPAQPQRAARSPDLKVCLPAYPGRLRSLPRGGGFSLWPRGPSRVPRRESAGAAPPLPPPGPAPPAAPRPLPSPRPRPPSKWPRRCGRGPARPLGLPSADAALTAGPGGHGPGARGHEEAPGGGDGRRGGRARAARWRDARAALSAAQNQHDFQNGGSGRKAGMRRPIRAASWELARAGLGGRGGRSPLRKAPRAGVEPRKGAPAAGAGASRAPAPPRWRPVADPAFRRESGQAASRAAGGSGRGAGVAALSGRTLGGLPVYCLRGSFPERRRSGRGSGRRREGGRVKKFTSS